ncbi:AURKAIP1/COX24 domain-containing protein [bacterium]|nr:AURKAIP1/COX24 domain-containing protein [bacterium]MBU1615559.1 AURKAIP1/COX24 domain-containing protein [bacterium]
MSSVVKKRRKKIRKHKYNKLRKATRIQRRRLGR